MTNEELEAKVRYLEDYIAIWKLQPTYAHYIRRYGLENCRSLCQENARCRDRDW